MHRKVSSIFRICILRFEITRHIKINGQVITFRLGDGQGKKRRRIDERQLKINLLLMYVMQFIYPIRKFSSNVLLTYVEKKAPPLKKESICFLILLKIERRGEANLQASKRRAFELLML